MVDQIPPDPYDLLASLLGEYDKTWTSYPEFVVQPLRDDPETRRIQRSLATDLDPATTNPLLATHNWWASWSARGTGRERFQCLYLLLRKLDDWFATKLAVQVNTAGGPLVLGRRWWDMLRICRVGSGLFSGPPFSIYSPFPHLRRMDPATEWIGDDDLAAAFGPVARQGELRVGLCSLSGRAKTYFAGTSVLDFQRRVFGFRAEHILSDPESFYLDELRAVVEWARRDSVHILCLPELCVCPAGRHTLRAEIERDSGSLCLVLPGTYHDAAEGEAGCWVGTAPVWLVIPKRIRELPATVKTEPFSMPTDKAEPYSSMADAVTKARLADCKTLEEHLQPGISFRTVATPVGIFGVAICRDDLPHHPAIIRFREMLDHLFILSMNDSPTAWFWPKAEEASRHHAGATFYVNAAQTVDDLHAESLDLSFWHVPHVTDEVHTRVRFRRVRPGNPPRDGAEYRSASAEGTVLFNISVPPGMLLDLF